MSSGASRTSLLTLLALGAFAANSILCRLALGGHTIDAASFTGVRLIAGAITLYALLRGRRATGRLAGTWRTAGMLALHAVPFSFAYLNLTAGTGALLLFGAVQLTMLATALWSGERPSRWQWSGVVLALAGVAWGIYSLLGRGSADPLGETAGNFARAVPFAIAVSLMTVSDVHVRPTGLLLAIASGAVASGLGYVIWYAALRTLGGVAASIVQLAVPVLAAGGGVLLLGERITLRLVLAGVLVLGGVALAILRRSRPSVA